MKNSEMIFFEPKNRVFHLRGSLSSYLLGISPRGDLHLLHWGDALAEVDVVSLIARWRQIQKNPLLEQQNFDFGSYGNNDLRSPALLLGHADGSRLSEFLYQSHEIIAGKPEFPGPQAYVESSDEASTLCILLKDLVSGQLLKLYYTIYFELDVITRRAEIKQGPQVGCILRFMSASFDMPSADYWTLSLPGDWARERMVQKAPLQQGLFRFESRRGMSNRMSPFVAVSDGEPSENFGQAWGISLVYSGNWLIEAERHPSGRLRLNAGLNDFDFRWQMDAGETFVAPECVLVWSGKGMGELSRKMHALVRTRICRGPWRDRARPVLINSWESFTFNFKHNDIMQLAKDGKELGVELLVLDDGWFGKRDDDSSSLGDWFDDKNKLPFGIKGLAEEIHGIGLKFGLWFEPEMISPVSELFLKHPEWALAVPGRNSSTWRNQFVLDMSRVEVRDFLFNRLAHYVEEAKIDYIKWDMNRPLWEVGSQAWPPERQAELSHRFIMGTYELMGRLRDSFPDLLVEGCGAGGSRFDLGMLCYHPQYWTSDNTDAYDRIFIQWGSSFFLPPFAMCSHVSETPNHITNRSVPMSLRGNVAMSGNYGLQLDLAKLTQQERKEIADQIVFYREIRPLIQNGIFFRLADPYHDARPAWSFVSNDASEALVFVFQPRMPMRGLDSLPLKLKGLNPELKYKVSGLDQRWSGAFLMQQGLIPEFQSGDFQSAVYKVQSSS